MAHPARQEWAEHVAAETGGVIVWDEVGNVWDTRRRSLLAGTGTHVMVLQDDAVPSEGLVESVTRAIEYSQDFPVSLYATAGNRVRAALALQPAAWWTGEGPTWGVGLVIPTSHIPGMLERCDRMRFPQDDKRITHYYANRMPTWYTVPSLVDHLDGPSLTGPNPHPRKAERFGSGLNVDWSAPPVATNRDNLYPIVEMRKGDRTVKVRLYTRLHRKRLAEGWKTGEPPEGGSPRL